MSDLTERLRSLLALDRRRDDLMAYPIGPADIGMKPVTVIYSPNKEPDGSGWYAPPHGLSGDSGIFRPGEEPAGWRLLWQEPR